MASIGQYLHLDPDDEFEASTPPGGVNERKFSSLKIGKPDTDIGAWKILFPVGPEVAMCEMLIEELNIIRAFAIQRDRAPKVAP